MCLRRARRDPRRLRPLAVVATFVWPCSQAAPAVSATASASPRAEAARRRGDGAPRSQARRTSRRIRSTVRGRHFACWLRARERRRKSRCTPPRHRDYTRRESESARNKEVLGGIWCEACRGRAPHSRLKKLTKLQSFTVEVTYTFIYMLLG